MNIAHHAFNKISRVFVQWLPLGFAITVLVGCSYVTGQQILRSGANDPEIEIAENTTQALSKGTPYEAFDAADPISIEQSLSPYVIIYNLDRIPVAGTATLNGSVPTPPKGVFDHAKEIGEHRLTWQPMPGVRQAIVVVYHTGMYPGYVLAGRSLREVEVRENSLLSMTELAWSVAMFGSLLLSAILS